jgi:maltooligosyltrehalose trehalohydrolase
MSDWQPSLGAVLLEEGRCRFRVWAPLAKRVEVHLLSPSERLVAMQPTKHGYHEIVIDAVRPEALYFYRLDGGRDRPDPASRSQPRGIHGPSQVIERGFAWTDACWRAPGIRDLVLYELHVGTFTEEGTFDAVVPHLAGLRELGITALEIMPVAAFPGTRNWGYDGVCPFAVQHSYGGPAGLKRLVDACHARGLAVVLDVVYNHLGPEGNYHGEFGPYFTREHRTPWGAAINIAGYDSDAVRDYFIENALVWLHEYHLDGLRLDATHAIKDPSSRPFLRELSWAVHAAAERAGRSFPLIAEHNQNDPRVTRAPDRGGWGLDAEWSDDFHNALHALLTGERNGYYQDFGSTEMLARTLREGYAFTGQYNAYRRRRFGASAVDLPSHVFVIYSQNHDQVGNRPRGERLSALTDFEGLKLAAAAMLLSPFTPLLFMGEEYGETNPFPFFTSHGDAHLTDAVRRGRNEGLTFHGFTADSLDPADDATFRAAHLNRALAQTEPHATLRALYRELLHLRRTLPALSEPSLEQHEVRCFERELCVTVQRESGEDAVCLLLCVAATPQTLRLSWPAGTWTRVIDTAQEHWRGSGTEMPTMLTGGEVALPMRRGAVLYRRERIS